MVELGEVWSWSRSGLCPGLELLSASVPDILLNLRMIFYFCDKQHHKKKEEDEVLDVCILTFSFFAELISRLYCVTLSELKLLFPVLLADWGSEGPAGCDHAGEIRFMDQTVLNW